MVIDNPDILRAISEIAKKENKPKTKVLDEILEKGIETKIKNRIPNYLIGNKDTYKGDPKEFLESGGFIKGIKPFNAVELVRQVRSGDYDIP